MVRLALCLFLAFSLSSFVSGQAISNEAGLVPAVSEATGGCTLSASSELDSVSNLLDRNESTYWVSLIVSEAWVECEFAQAKEVKAYAIRSNPAYFSTCAPTAWSLQYHDGSGWVNADTRSGISWSGLQTKSYSAVGVASTRWRVNMTAKPCSYYNINELYLYESVFDYDVISSVANNSILFTALGAGLAFDIQSNGFTLLGKWSDDIEICIDSPSITEVCRTLESWSDVVADAFRYSTATFHLDHQTEHSVTITSPGANLFYFDGINVIQHVSAPAGGGGGTVPTPTPNPAIVPISLADGVDGEFHYIVTAGETTIARIIILFVFSIWAMGFILLLRSRMK